MADMGTMLKDGIVSAGNVIGDRIVTGLPEIIIATIILLVGIFVGDILRRFIIIVSDKLKVDNWMDEQNLASALGGHKVSMIIGVLVQWYTVILFLAQAVDLISMPVLKDFLQLLIFYIPSILGALIVVIIGLLIGKYIENILKMSTFRMKKFMAGAAKIIIVYIAIVMALSQIGFDVSILIEAFKIAFTVFALVAGVLFGVAFASEYKGEIKYWSREMKKML